MTRLEAMNDALDSAAAFMQSWRCSTCAFPVDHECEYPDYASEVLFRFDELTKSKEERDRNERLAKDLDEIVEWGGISSYRMSLAAAAEALRGE
jgi:hypothetical protein